MSAIQVSASANDISGPCSETISTTTTLLGPIAPWRKTAQFLGQ
jgi:hypothetical protein